MKKIISIILIYFCMQLCAYSDVDYETLYDKAEVFSSKLYNDVDPYEDEDSLKYAWSPYPLFRTAANLYFKDFNIAPGYYILTPRKLKGDDYILFKQNGKVKFIIPSAKTESTPLNFYNANIPQPKKTKWQKFSTKVRDKFYDMSGDSMRSQPPKSLVDVKVEVNYIIVILYYGDDKYTMVFKRTPY